MSFTAEQFKELEDRYGLKPIAPAKPTLPVRDGVIEKDGMVWWRAKGGPQHVKADRQHWDNIRNYPDAYQLAQPQTKVVYTDGDTK